MIIISTVDHDPPLRIHLERATYSHWDNLDHQILYDQMYDHQMFDDQVNDDQEYDHQDQLWSHLDEEVWKRRFTINKIIFIMIIHLMMIKCLIVMINKITRINDDLSEMISPWEDIWKRRLTINEREGCCSDQNKPDGDDQGDVADGNAEGDDEGDDNGDAFGKAYEDADCSWSYWCGFWWKL